jgi:hypothetical protein
MDYKYMIYGGIVLFIVIIIIIIIFSRKKTEMKIPTQQNFYQYETNIKRLLIDIEQINKSLNEKFKTVEKLIYHLDSSKVQGERIIMDVISKINIISDLIPNLSTNSGYNIKLLESLINKTDEIKQMIKKKENDK